MSLFQFLSVALIIISFGFSLWGLILCRITQRNEKIKVIAYILFGIFLAVVSLNIENFGH